jgi:hypothetical protein
MEVSGSEASHGKYFSRNLHQLNLPLRSVAAVTPPVVFIEVKV